MMVSLSKQYLTIILWSGVAVVALGSMWWVYQWRTSLHNEHASTLFAQSLEEMQKALRVSDKKYWSEVGHAFSAVYNAEPKAPLAAYAQAFEAIAAQRQGKGQEAIALLEKAIAHMSQKSPLYYAYSIKLALMKIDADDHVKQESGRAELEKLAADVHNPLREMALYYQGYESWLKNDKKSYEKIWSHLLRKADADSFWAEKVREKLQYL